MKLVIPCVVLVLASCCSAHFGAKPNNIQPFKYMSRNRGKPATGEFPTDTGRIINYKSLFSDNPNAAELFENMDYDTEQVHELEEYKKNWYPPHVVEVIPGKVYQAMGFAMGYPVVYVTPNDTLIWIDAPESVASALECIDAFRAYPAIGTKRVEALIYTLFHGDHIWGARAIVNDPYNNGVAPTIIADSNLLTEAYMYDTFKSFKSPRLFRMFGLFIPSPPHIHDAVVQRLRLEGPYRIEYPPTDTLYFPSEDVTITRTIGGLELEFISIPGYTSDQIIVWTPAWKVIHGADAFETNFPNMYTLRGEPGRNVLKWAQGTERVNSFDAECLVVTHTWPLCGSAAIKDTLTTFADAIRYVHDQVVRYMSKGYPPDIIPRVVNLPPNLASKPYLRQVYGIEDTAIKGIFDFYVGWFSGLTEDLFPVDRFERGERLIEMVGVMKMRIEAARAYNEGRYEWALELATYLWYYNQTDRFALDVRTESMKRMSEVLLPMTARNYLAATVMEDWDLVNNVVKTDTAFVALHLDGAMKNLQFHVDNTKVENVHDWLCVHLLDLNEAYQLEIRHSILAYDKVAVDQCSGPVLAIKEQCDLDDPTDIYCWRFMLAGHVPFTAGEITNGSTDDVNRFFSYFDFKDEQEGGYSPGDEVGK